MAGALGITPEICRYDLMCFARLTLIAKDAKMAKRTTKQQTTQHTAQQNTKQTKKNTEQTTKTGDFDEDLSPAANIGKRFYTWATLGTFAGASFLVTSLWQTLKSFQIAGYGFENLGWPLVLSASVIILFAFASEPKSQTTTRADKAQKALITVANTLLVFFAVIGGTVLVSGS